MTICIAAICDNNKKLIVSSDRMITVSHLSQEFEHGIPKMEKISPTCLAVTAGSALVPRELFSNVRKWASAISNPSIAIIVEKVKESFNILRIKKAEEKYIKSRGFKDITDFYERTQTLPPQLVIPLDTKIAEEQLGVEILIAGVDNEGAHIYWISEPGIAECFDSICYSAVGSGEPHALHTFIAEEYDSETALNNALFIVYEAKRNSENAPGVGTNTDMWVIGEGKITKVNEAVLNELEKIHAQKKEVLSKGNKEVEEKIKNLKISK